MKRKKKAPTPTSPAFRQGQINRQLSARIVALEKQAMKLFEQIQSMGGAVNAIEQGFQENELGKSAYEYMKKVKNREVMVVGVNAYQTSEKPRILTTRVDYGEERRQIERLQRLRRERNNDRVAAALKDLSEAARERVNLIEPVLEAVRVYATGGEVFSVLRDIYGEYKSAGLMV